MRIMKLSIKKFRKIRASKKIKFKLTGDFEVTDDILWLDIIVEGDDGTNFTCKMSKSGKCIVLPSNTYIPKKYEDEVWNFIENLDNEDDFKEFYNESCAEFLKFPKVYSSEGDIICHQFRMLKSMYDGKNTFLGSFYIDTNENKIVRTEEADE